MSLVGPAAGRSRYVARTHGNRQKHETANPLQAWRIDRFHAKVIRVVEQLEPTSVLDVGCGEGYVLEALQAAGCGARLVGVDRSTPAIADARTRLGREVDLRVGDVEDLVATDRHSDLVLMLEVLEHLEDPTAALDALAKVSDGWILVSVPWEPWFRLLNLLRLKNVRGLGNDPEHVNHWTRRSFRRFVSSRLVVHDTITAFPWTLVLAVMTRALRRAWLPGLLMLGLVLLAIQLQQQASELDQFQLPSRGALVLTVAAAVAGQFAFGLAWTRLLPTLRAPRALAWTFHGSQPAKYVPIGVAQPIGQVSLLRQLGVPVTQGTVAWVSQLTAFVAAGLFLGAGTAWTGDGWLAALSAFGLLAPLLVVRSLQARLMTRLSRWSDRVPAPESIPAQRSLTEAFLLRVDRCGLPRHGLQHPRGRHAPAPDGLRIGLRDQHRDPAAGRPGPARGHPRRGVRRAGRGTLGPPCSCGWCSWVSSSCASGRPTPFGVR